MRGINSHELHADAGRSERLTVGYIHIYVFKMSEITPYYKLLHRRIWTSGSLLQLQHGLESLCYILYAKLHIWYTLCLLNSVKVVVQNKALELAISKV